LGSATHLFARRLICLTAGSFRAVRILIPADRAAGVIAGRQRQDSTADSRTM